MENIGIQPTRYNVYARVNSKNQVIKIFSDCFEQPEYDDVLIKSGSGDEFVHVGYYQIYNRDNTYHYKIQNGKLYERTEKDREEDLYCSSLKATIITLERKLDDTDYQAIKHAEGQLSDSEYEGMLNQRIAWRDEINQLKAELKRLSE